MWERTVMKTHTQLLLGTIGCLALAWFTGSCRKATTPGIGPCFEGPIGLQLYSLRDQFATNMPGTFDEVKRWGIRYVELAGTYGLAPDQFKTQLAARGIEPIAAHFGYEEYRDNPDAVALKAKELGLKYDGCAWIPHQGDFDEKSCREAAAVFNKAGEALATTGGGGKTLQCSICHGADYKGIGNVPGLAGRSAVYIVRQLYDIQHGARKGVSVALIENWAMAVSYT